MASRSAIKLHGYFASSTSFLARAALNLKGVNYTYIPQKVEHEGQVTPDGGYQPTLEDGENYVQQTGAIFNYIDETFPEPPLLPYGRTERARVRSIATFVACEIQPFGFYRVEKFLREHLHMDEVAIASWNRHWLVNGFQRVEHMLQDPETGRFCHRDTPSMADLFLIPQVHRSQQAPINVDLKRFPLVKSVYESCLAHPAFQKALPENQPDSDRAP